MSKSEKLYISRYNDFYGCLLTKHQCEMIKLYYDCDISLFEISEQFNVSRQAVRDTIKRAEQLLDMYEQKLGLVRKSSKLQARVQKIEDSVSSGDKDSALEQIKCLREILEDNDGDI